MARHIREGTIVIILPCFSVTAFEKPLPYLDIQLMKSICCVAATKRLCRIQYI